MDEFPRPPLDPGIYEDLDSRLYAIEENYWRDLQALQFDRVFLRLPGTPIKPTPPKLPGKLRDTLASYAHVLFYTEACEYPSDDPLLERWLRGLADRTERRVDDAISEMENGAIFRSLEHHGLSESERQKIVHEAVHDALLSRLEETRKSSKGEKSIETQDGEQLDDLQNRPLLLRQFEAYKQIKKLVSGPHELIPEALVRRTIAQQYDIQPEEVTSEQIRHEVSGLLPFYPAIRLIPSTPAVPLNESHDPIVQSASTSKNEEIGRRERLLAEYKAATQAPSNKRIYEAKNSGIHKPEFYQWVNGSLPANSSTTVAFERFLREKKSPIPRRSKD